MKVVLKKRIDFSGCFMLPGIPGELKTVNGEQVVEVKNLAPDDARPWMDHTPKTYYFKYYPETWTILKQE